MSVKNKNKSIPTSSPFPYMPHSRHAVIDKSFSRFYLSVLSCCVVAFPPLASATVSYPAEHYIDAQNVLHLSGGDSKNYFRLLTADSRNDQLEFSGISVSTNPAVIWNQYSISFSNGASLSVNGRTSGTFIATSIPDPDGNNIGTYALYAGNGSQLNFNGDVDLIVEHNIPENQADCGANLLYARYQSQISIGNEEILSRLWVLASQPDLISAKNGSAVTFLSTKNQLVGSIDMMDDLSPKGEGNNQGNSISITLAGADSYWFGDEKSWMNSDAHEFQSGDQFSISLEDGAQWTYFGLNYGREVGGKVYSAIKKRISSITLKGGIINLFDDNIEEVWKDIGLWDRLNNGEYGIKSNMKHDYVRIGELQGEGGIFRLDLNAEDKTQSDMVYIEKGSGSHYFEPYNLTLLESVTPENTLTFALTGKESTIEFSDKVNLEGETLFDYELEINSKPIAAEEITDEENSYWDKTAALGQNDPSKIDLSDFEGGTNWFIQRITLSESAAARAMTGIGYATYDAAVEMDRHDRRLAETLRSTDTGSGLWVRAIRGRSGVDNQYLWDRAGIVIGFDHAIDDSNTLGAWFSYVKGEADLLDVNGTGDLTRCEFALYDTFSFGSQYIDLVGRIGRVSTEFDVASTAYHTSGDFDQDYAAFSIEYGWTLLHDSTGLFVEPQTQVQAAYLKSYDYGSDRGMTVEADSSTSVLGRLGIRAGKQLTDNFAAGQIYVRADVLHQFTDGQDAEFRDNVGHTLRTNWGNSDTWGLVGIGGSVNWGDGYGLQLDVERAFGGQVENTWIVSGRFNCRFW